jgi:hypothetical protein
VEKFVAVVICALVVAPATGAAPSSGDGRLLRAAAERSGLTVQRVVPERTLRGDRYDALLQRAVERNYPRALRNTDLTIYTQLGLLPAGSKVDLVPHSTESRVWYDPGARSLLLRRATTPQRSRIINELVRALVDQHFNLHRLTGLRLRNRDYALAAQGIVEGTAALASGVRATSAARTPLARFLQLDSGVEAGRALARQLRYLGGSRALATAFTTFPQTTEQLMHIDKFLERERALPVRLPKQIGELQLRTSETFGELDVRSLLAAYRVPNAGTAAAGWGGGRVGLYVSPRGETTTVLALIWDSYDDAVEWRTAIAAYVPAAFPGASASDCPPLDRCWQGSANVAIGAMGTSSVFASGPAAAMAAAAALAAN